MSKPIVCKRVEELSCLREFWLRCNYEQVTVSEMIESSFCMLLFQFITIRFQILTGKETLFIQPL